MKLKSVYSQKPFNSLLGSLTVVVPTPNSKNKALLQDESLNSSLKSVRNGTLKLCPSVRQNIVILKVLVHLTTWGQTSKSINFMANNTCVEALPASNHIRTLCQLATLKIDLHATFPTVIRPCQKCTIAIQSPK